MSTKSTLFLTRDNEHCYYETNSPHKNENGEFIGYDIHLEIDAKNVFSEKDEEGVYLIFQPGSEIYKLIQLMDIEHPKPVEQPTRSELIRDLKVVWKHNEELKESLSSLKERLE